MNSRKRFRWTPAEGGPAEYGMGAAHHGGGRMRAEKSNIPLERDFLAGALARDAESRGRELWLGLALAACVIALVVSGLAVPALAILFCAAPLVGIWLEIFSPRE